MNYLPKGKEEIELVKFIARYEYLQVSDAKYFFESTKYYKYRIKKLIDKRILRRIKWKLVLGDFGIQYVKLLGFEYNRLNRNKKYTERLMRISNLAAFYHKCKGIRFTPSFSIKDKQVFTKTSRRYIGILEVNGFKYLTYYISEKNDSKYITSVIYDIQKEMEYDNFIVFINDINRINAEDFVTGRHSTLIIEDNEENRKKLKYLNRLDWYKLIQNMYGEEVVLSPYYFCEYTDYKEKYISPFYFFDAEAMWRLKIFMRESPGKKFGTAICDKRTKELLEKHIPNARFVVINLEEHIDKYKTIWIEGENGPRRCYIWFLNRQLYK